ncbi:hypothetical protein GYMLUDRAFT_760904 [Collybiopsis luxurians FD-317 M1]|uniref:Aminotransferase class I/classII large domain-containing protein n=1 Tax=Collybiopsis luxurians FD-317 M1 TaxID=944289 RepID=A0A0D0CQ01_9AGAR|nr:hypothetical protein GYMLUDRAFT_760904 [Collybiopsis luxurians FD-317 M1]
MYTRLHNFCKKEISCSFNPKAAQTKSRSCSCIALSLFKYFRRSAGAGASVASPAFIWLPLFPSSSPNRSYLLSFHPFQRRINGHLGPASHYWTCSVDFPLLNAHDYIHPPILRSQGVPGTAPHPLLQQSLRETALRQDAWGYCPAEGEPSLREALAREMKRIYSDKGQIEQVDITPSDLALTSGCNLAFVAIIMAIADAGDEVILPVPWYFNHQMTLTLLGISPIPLITSPSSSFLPSPSLAASLITPKTRAIALVTPNNPTGAEYPPSLISEFARLAQERGIALILDETYRDFITPTKPAHDLYSFDKSFEYFKSSTWRSSVISLYSFSKSYRIPGHRLGAITASPELLREVVKVLDTLQICAPRLPQLALASLSQSPATSLTPPATPNPQAEPSSEPVSTILSSLGPDIVSTAVAIDARHKLFRSTLEQEAPRWKIASQGAYYAFVRHPFAGRGSEEVCRRLVEEVGVRVLPGAFFFDSTSSNSTSDELDRFIRFSVANVSDDKVVQVCQRLGEAERKFGWDIEVEM